MKFREFEMERWQSIWENTVEYNLTESGVHPITSADLGMTGDEFDAATIALTGRWELEGRAERIGGRGGILLPLMEGAPR